MFPVFPEAKLNRLIAWLRVIYAINTRTEDLGMVRTVAGYASSGHPLEALRAFTWLRSPADVLSTWPSR